MATRTLRPQEIGERLEPLFRDPAVELVVLFGSTISGRARCTSDIDLGVAAAIDMTALTTEVIRLLGTDRVDVVDLRRASPLLAMVVAREGRPLHEGHPGAFAAFASLSLRRYNDTAGLRRLAAEALRRFVEARGLGA